MALVNILSIHFSLSPLTHALTTAWEQPVTEDMQG
uniref:Uncharacterized protein n=1 Tax=Rhizophora mucronata TaxID=61149 RepID=A0A2P2J2I4_RHIMU